jgi:hypothetical protein
MFVNSLHKHVHCPRYSATDCCFGSRSATDLNLIIAISAVQYLAASELDRLLGLWRQLLRRNGMATGFYAERLPYNLEHNPARMKFGA